jgi:hypothetical protein
MLLDHGLVKKIEAPGHGDTPSHDPVRARLTGREACTGTDDLDTCPYPLPRSNGRARSLVLRSPDWGRGHPRGSDRTVRGPVLVPVRYPRASRLREETPLLQQLVVASLGADAEPR